MPHHYIIMRASDPAHRKREARDATTRHNGTLDRFWVSLDGTECYALIRDVDDADAVLREVKGTRKYDMREVR